MLTCYIQVYVVYATMYFIRNKFMSFDVKNEYRLRSAWVRVHQLFLILSRTSPGFYLLAVQVFGKHNGKRRKGEISPFPTVFFTGLENFLLSSSNLKLSSANFFSLAEYEICRLGKNKERSLSLSPDFSISSSIRM